MADYPRLDYRRSRVAELLAALNEITAATDNARLEAAMRICEIVCRSSADECAVLTALARRLDAGRATYGPLTKATDQRHFLRELGDELRDALIYLEMAGL
jgi:hypothetical protein